jgi:hypothetical protein
MNDEFDITQLNALKPDALLRLRTQTRNEITLLRSEQNNGGPNRSEQIQAVQKKLRAINAILEPAK